jgi:EH_Signature domain
LNFTLEALRQLAAEDQVIRQRAALPPVNGPHACQQLGNALNKLRQKLSVVKLDRPKLNAERVWSAFAASQYNLGALDGLQFRTLCSDEKTALRSEFIAALTRSPEKLKRSRCLYGMVNGYFSEWRTMIDPTSVEQLLTAVFSSYDGKNQVVQKWYANKRLFSEQAATCMADEICSSQKAVDDVLKDYYIGPLTKLGQSVRASAARSACEYLRRTEGSRDSEWSVRYLQWMTESVLSELTLPDAFYYAISTLILSESARRSESFQRALRSYVQNHKRLGDPRVRESSLNWRSIAPEAAQRYLSWLARDSIIFFFNTILPNNNENRRRKDFWLRYHDRIRDFQVAVSEADLWKVKASQKNSELLYYSHVAHPTTSAFLMRFEGYGRHYIVVEFSEKGNAAYIFTAADFESKRVTMRTPRFDLKKHLKFDDSHRILHMGDWEPKASYKLSSEFGIRP